MMYVYYGTENPPGREHPWTVVASNPDDKYVDFKLYPDKIPLVLLDFTPWSHYAAVQTFYSLLRWLNGADSVFESNDCGLRPPRQDPDTPVMIRRVFDANPIVMCSRLTIIFRDLVWNTSGPTVDGLKTAIHDGLRDNVPNFAASLEVGEWAHLFTAINREGRAVTLGFWAWGDDQAMAMANLNGTFDAIHGCLRWISDGIKSRV
jgi:hypothetical protein